MAAMLCTPTALYHPRRSSAPRRARRAVHVCAAGQVGIEEGHQLLERGGYLFLDLRSARAYDDAHITKPARKTFNVPMDSITPDTLLAGVQAKIPALSSQLLVCDADGASGSAEAAALLAQHYTDAVQVEGGWEAWSAVFSTSGRRKPPAGRWVHTGKEALKSGLTVGAADTYEEGGSKDGVRLQP